ncbi:MULTISPECIES: ADP-forming succinate--CoA ligase subunit beta [Cohaesibacter]|uniref:ADP-forming succinate--CoA ligase subunit beta n=1 Tax=Cohaesibacter TaxID=655352 RepID=UPI000DEB5B03|nr:MULTISPECIES: ADP-forming succinate--CoA ligase subunit beta [Cohaesibacter]TLP46928.1 ADP-forming succinate--CoA ligase subunit beta [Cohaesibacter sp. CAU 1516]
MNIHEYQAKAILKGFGAPVSNGVVIYSADEAAAAVETLPGPVWVVKSQIHAGGRGKGKFVEESAGEKGGVRVCFSKEEAIENAQKMLGAHLVTEQTGPEGKQVHRIYIEDGSDIEKEMYLSLLVDRGCGQVTFIVSTEGGMDIEKVADETPEKILNLPVNPDHGVTVEMALQICDKLGLEGTAREDGLVLFPMLYAEFVEKDMAMLEINPLIINGKGHLTVLDAKVSFDGNALFRHPQLLELRDMTEEDDKEIEAFNHELAYVALEGNIGCMVNGAGLAMATMDIIKLYGGEPANFLDVGGGATAQKVAAAFKIITSDPNVQGILVNIFGGIMRCDTIAEGVLSAVREVGLQVPLVVRLEGTRVNEGKKLINDSDLNVIPADDLNDAAQKIVAAVKGA